jgi:NAD(P)H-quinone oxidoreductase subunit 5
VVRRAARRSRVSLLIGDVALVAAAAVALATIGEVDLRSPGQAAQALAGSAGSGGGSLGIVALLLVVASISRCALVPLHRWLPATVAAPTPVSALLHAGVVNGGGVLLVRSAEIFGAVPVATHLAFAAAVTTAVLATAVMLVRSDVKGNLAWSTSGQMGFMIGQIAVGAPPAALFHLVGHGMYKAALFLGSGGAVTRHLHHRHLPAPTWVAPRPVRLAAAIIVPAAAIVTGYLVLDPHLPPAGAVLVVVFAWLTAAHALDGWFRSAPFAPLPTLLIAVVGTTAAVFAYLGGLKVFEGFVAASLPEELPGAVSPTILVATLVVLGLAGGIIGFGPGSRLNALRMHVYTLLLSTSLPRPTVRRERPGSADGRSEVGPQDTRRRSSRRLPVTSARSESPRP